MKRRAISVVLLAQMLLCLGLFGDSCSQKSTVANCDNSDESVESNDAVDIWSDRHVDEPGIADLSEDINHPDRWSDFEIVRQDASGSETRWKITRDSNLLDYYKDGQTQQIAIKSDDIDAIGNHLATQAFLNGMTDGFKCDQIATDISVKFTLRVATTAYQQDVSNCVTPPGENEEASWIYWKILKVATEMSD